MANMRKYVGNYDIMTTKVDGGGDTVTSCSKALVRFMIEIKLMDIDSQQYWMSEEAEYALSKHDIVIVVRNF